MQSARQSKGIQIKRQKTLLARIDRNIKVKFTTKIYNIWAVNENFATTFGMPKEFISQELVGIEAAAFRIEPSGFFFLRLGAQCKCM
ncbi:hypothetical protein GKO28_00540 [Deefgea sp. CFH1-16]|nr:hypothetical protein [Deefgea sp. CFH1-16]